MSLFTLLPKKCPRGVNCSALRYKKKKVMTFSLVIINLTGQCFCSGEKKNKLRFVVFFSGDGNILLRKTIHYNKNHIFISTFVIFWTYYILNKSQKLQDSQACRYGAKGHEPNILAGQSRNLSGEKTSSPFVSSETDRLGKITCTHISRLCFNTALLYCQKPLVKSAITYIHSLCARQNSVVDHALHLVPSFRLSLKML